MYRIRQDLWLFALREMLVQILHVQHLRELRSSILSIWTEILVQLLQTFELAVRRTSLVSIGTQCDDPDGISLLRSLLHDRH